MPTINQLVRKGRSNKTRKSKSPVLGIGYNSKDKKQTNQNSPQKRQTLPYVNMPVLDFLMVWK